MPLALFPFNRGLAQVAPDKVMMTLKMRRTHASIPMLGLSLAGMLPGEAGEAVESALQIGYRCFDICARDANLAAVGTVFRKHFLENQTLPRKDVWITVKTKHVPEHNVIDDASAIVSTLNCGYVDLIMPDWMVAEGATAYHHPSFMALWRAHEKLIPPHNRLSRHIGVANVSRSKLEGLLLRDCKVIPDAIQNEVHLRLQMRGLAHSCQMFDVPLLAAHICPESVCDTSLVKQACHRKKLTPLQLSVKWCIRRKLPCVVNTSDPTVLQQAFDAAVVHVSDGSQREDALGGRFLLLSQAEVDALSLVDRGPPGRLIGAELSDYWDT
ncbi:Aldo-keto reductase family 4 member C10 [Diplonema papillatum]|nr:Aldo-keto reductase family 4 member C10 [Diplonema papillatum]